MFSNSENQTEKQLLNLTIAPLTLAVVLETPIEPAEIPPLYDKVLSVGSLFGEDHAGAPQTLAIELDAVHAVEPVTLVDIATMPLNRRAKRMKAAARINKAVARINGGKAGALDRVRFLHTRAAFFCRKARTLAVRARAAIAGAFVVMSRAVRQPRRARRPAASRAGPKAAASDGSGGVGDDDRANLPSAPDEEFEKTLVDGPAEHPEWTDDLGKHSPAAWEWVKKQIARGYPEWWKPSDLKDRIADIDLEEAVKDRIKHGRPRHRDNEWIEKFGSCGGDGSTSGGQGGGGSRGVDPPHRPIRHGHGPRRGALRDWSFHPGGRPGSWSQRVALAGGAL
jgi:hypothetical protein